MGKPSCNGNNDKLALFIVEFARPITIGGKCLSNKGPRKSVLLGDDGVQIHDNVDDYLEATKDTDNAEESTNLPDDREA